MKYCGRFSFLTTICWISVLLLCTHDNNNNLFVRGQQAGLATTEVHPPLTTYTCTASGCTPQTQSVTIDANWRWVHETGASLANCFTGSVWDTTICTDPVTCAKNCAVDGANYEGVYGITTSASSLSLQLVTGTNVGSRVYLMEDDENYQMFNLKNREFTFTVDVSKLPCGLNGALYFVEMDKDGGTARFPENTAGAKYGTGYCDAQCPQDVKFLNGEANIVDWDADTCIGQFGSCCIELDIWEANSVSSAYTPHPCSITGQYRCNGTECGAGSLRYDGVCDKDGCDFNSYRMGDTTFYGPGLTVDTTQPVTVVTQFITDDGTDTGVLSEMRRIYVQNGKEIPNSMGTWPGLSSYDSITDQMCSDAKVAFGDTDDFTSKGGLKAMGDALDRGMVLVMSLWTDTVSNMLWLDSLAPLTKPSTAPGVARGTCDVTSGDSATVESQSGSSTVVFSDVKWGTIGSTTSGTILTPAAVPSTTAPVVPPSEAAAPSSTTAPSTDVPPTTPTTSTSGSCSASLVQIEGGTWPGDSGLVRLTITNTGTLPISDVKVFLTAPGTVNSICLDADSNTPNEYSVPAWAFPIGVGASFSEAGIVYNNGRPSVVITPICA